MIRIAAIAGFLLAAILMRLVLMHVSNAYGVDRAQPLTVVTYWQTDGLWMCGALLTGIAAALCGYVQCLRTFSRAARYCALACIAALCVPAVFSSDVYAYAAYGQMLAHGMDPYSHARVTVHDPLLDAAQWQWGNPLPVCVYGPLFLVLARFAVLFAPLGAAAPLWVLRIAACAALAACVPLAQRAYAWLPERERLRAACIIALNPAAIWACAEGHNDVFAIACVLGGMAVMRRMPFWGGVLAGISGAIKGPAAAAALVAWRAAQGRAARIRAAAGSAVGIAVTLAASVPLLVAATHDLAPHGKFAPHFSPLFLFSLIAPMPVAVAVAAICAVGVLAAGRGRAAYIVIALLMLVPNPYPWYGIWLLPVAAAVRSRYEQYALIAASVLLMLRYFGEASSLLWPVSEAAIVIATFGTPLAIFAGSGLSRSRRRESHTAAPDLAPDRLP
ncbi:MAG TPA: glycosyltransferase 87 family protein [Candidatus Baltobacteraceae bacterium]|nr:glycosyltransferase 87 family protein [Candidatus Baltobacteraceae bacterium]